MSLRTILPDLTNLFLQIILLAPLPFLTVFLSLHIQHRYVAPSKKLSLERAVKIDALADPPEFSHEAYQQPVLTEKAAVPARETASDVHDEVLSNLAKLKELPMDETSSHLSVL